MTRFVLLIAIAVLAIFGAASTVEATKAHGASIHGDVVGDGGSDSGYCGSWEAAVGKTVYMPGPRGLTWYTCRHFGWTNDNFVYQTCGWCWTGAYWHLPSSFSNWPYNADIDAWDAW